MATEAKKTVLVACPFCGEVSGVMGSHVSIRITEPKMYYILSPCGARGPEATSRKRAVENWNARKPAEGGPRE